MADSAVEFLLENLKQLKMHHADLIKEARDEVELFEEKLRVFKSFLKKVSVSSRKQPSDDTVEALVRDVRSLVYDAEDIIDAVVTQAAENKTKNYFSKVLNTSVGLTDIADQLGTICKRITHIYGDDDNLGIADDYVEDDLCRLPKNRNPIEESGYNNVISIPLSYEKLPYHLKECFLYMGVLEGYEIRAGKLIRMWIAEGFIQPKDGISMEEIAESYLDHLINMNLVRVEKLKADGRVKTCRVHDMIRDDFYKNEGGKDGENFLQEMKDGQKHRRLCIHSNVLNFFDKIPISPHIRSFVTFTENMEMPLEKSNAIFAALKQLRVLEARPLKFCKMPALLNGLVHLRYLVVSLKRGAILHKALNKLWNIQTLEVDTPSLTLDIKADVMSMTQLRHLKISASITLANPGSKDSEGGENLQYLSTLSTESCTEEIFGRAPNLKKLGIRGKIASFLDGKSGSFDSLRSLTSLEKLKLQNDNFPNMYEELDGLPPAYKFPENLKSLTLINTYLDWTHMSVLGSLKKLQVLKLKERAFVGSRWVVDDRGGFESLEFLQIKWTDLSIWMVSAHHFPSLKRVKLHNCERLKQLPMELADFPKLEYLELERCDEAAHSARNIAAAKKNKNNNVYTFKLYIWTLEGRSHQKILQHC